MLPKDENELLCRVGPGTTMGNLLRQYRRIAGQWFAWRSAVREPAAERPVTGEREEPAAAMQINCPAFRGPRRSSNVGPDPALQAIPAARSGGGRPDQPSRSSTSPREDTPSLVATALRCRRTVTCEIPSSAAISRVGSCCWRSSTTCHSRAVSSTRR